MSTDSQNGIHRLLDIVVEEVSLVDRAANNHRFLIVKRSDPVEEKQTEKTKTPDGEAGRTAKQTPAENPTPDAGDAGLEDGDAAPEGGEAAPDRGMLEDAVAALERLTETVNTLNTFADGDARGNLGAIATELRALADRLVEAAGSEPVEPPEPESELSVVIESVRATLQQVGSLIEASKAAPAKGKPKSDPGPDGKGKPQGEKEKRDLASGDDLGKPTPDDRLRKDLSVIAGSMKKLVEALKDQAQRLSKLEKRFGLPNSAPAREDHNRQEDEEVGWPMDLNRPFGRENVDKTVSFHDL